MRLASGLRILQRVDRRRVGTNLHTVDCLDPFFELHRCSLSTFLGMPREPGEVGEFEFCLEVRDRAILLCFECDEVGELCCHFLGDIVQRCDFQIDFHSCLLVENYGVVDFVIVPLIGHVTSAVFNSPTAPFTGVHSVQRTEAVYDGFAVDTAAVLALITIVTAVEPING